MKGCCSETSKAQCLAPPPKGGRCLLTVDDELEDSNQTIPRASLGRRDLIFDLVVFLLRNDVPGHKFLSVFVGTPGHNPVRSIGPYSRKSCQLTFGRFIQVEDLVARQSFLDTLCHRFGIALQLRGSPGGLLSQLVGVLRLGPTPQQEKQEKKREKGSGRRQDSHQVEMPGNPIALCASTHGFVWLAPEPRRT
jgi:hypothetical protein